MHQFLPEGLHPQPEGYTKEESAAGDAAAENFAGSPRSNATSGTTCMSRSAAAQGVMPRAEAARGILGGETRDIAILSRVGRPICFTVMGFAPDGTALLSRRSAQEAALEQIFREKQARRYPARRSHRACAVRCVLRHRLRRSPDCLDCGISVYPGLHIRAICCGSGSGCLF